MTDITKRLREWGHRTTTQNHDDAIVAAKEIERLRMAAERAANIIDTNLMHQREKLQDASRILRDALNETSNQ